MGDISNWDVSKVEDMIEIFDLTTCEKPWWAIEDNELRKEAIEKHKLMKEIEKILPTKESLSKIKQAKI